MTLVWEFVSYYLALAIVSLLSGFLVMLLLGHIFPVFSYWDWYFLAFTAAYLTAGGANFAYTWRTEVSKR